jgi:hypothetical protein
MRILLGGGGKFISNSTQHSPYLSEHLCGRNVAQCTLYMNVAYSNQSPEVSYPVPISVHRMQETSSTQAPKPGEIKVFTVHSKFKSCSRRSMGVKLGLSH